MAVLLQLNLVKYTPRGEFLGLLIEKIIAAGPFLISVLIELQP